METYSILSLPASAIFFADVTKHYIQVELNSSGARDIGSILISAKLEYFPLSHDRLSDISWNN